ncbi:zinc finger protein 346 isoform X1 [Gopherus flavomarginatus]|uniref:zinc finger protein 346 isoform X1 n=1 Tax=Gopherus flavomarginatus TaxID=286002 RepID=UPI0021CC04CF|nr:zinc finger protein 346 isoform X1 [Gopherus flavomarginatus]
MAAWAGSNGDAAALPVGKAAVDRMIRENSHIFTDAQCKVCSAVLISESQKLAHYQSKKHANKVRRYMSIHGEEELRQGKKIKLETKQESSNGEDRNKCCPICNMTFSSPVVAMSHYLGKTHAKNLKLKQQSPRVEVTMPPQKCPANFPPSAVSSNEENQSTSDPDKFCSLCHATFNNPLMAKQHYVGKKHRKQETKLKLMAHYGRTPDAPASSSMGKRQELFVMESPGDALDLLPTKPGRTLGSLLSLGADCLQGKKLTRLHLLGAFSILCPSVSFSQRVHPSGVLGKPEGPAPPLCSQT